MMTNISFISKFLETINTTSLIVSPGTNKCDGHQAAVNTALQQMNKMIRLNKT